MDSKPTEKEIREISKKAIKNSDRVEAFEEETYKRVSLEAFELLNETIPVRDEHSMMVFLNAYASTINTIAINLLMSYHKVLDKSMDMVVGKEIIDILDDEELKNQIGKP